MIKALMFISDLFKKFPKLLIGNLLLLIAANIVGIIALSTVAPVIDYYLNSTTQNTSIFTHQISAIFRSVGLPPTFTIFVATLLIFQILKNVLNMVSRTFISKTWNIILCTLFREALGAFFEAQWAFFSGNKQGLLFNTLWREIQIMGDSFKAVMLLFSGLIQLSFCLIIPFYLSWKMTSACLIAGLILTTPIFYMSRISYKLGKQSSATANETIHVIQENLAMAKVILSFGNQNSTIKKVSEYFSNHFRFVVKAQILREIVPFLYEPLGILVVVIGLSFAQKFSLPISNAVIIFLAFRYAIPTFSSILAQHSALINYYPSYEQVKRLKKQAAESIQPSGKRRFLGFKREILVENVSFSHQSHKPVLIDITVRIPKGKMIAIVGASGAGKTTLIDTIMGFYQPGRGRIVFDGISLSEFDVNSYRQSIGYVPQDSALFNVSIRDNLRWANSSASEDEIRYACRQANADEFIEKLLNGYDAIVGDRGVRLSGGQVQRIALARAILRKPELLILDEATSSLDTHSERLIQKAIETIARETTVVVVAHRFSTIINADYIYVMEEGRVVEEGRYPELIDMKGHFSKMAQFQTLKTAG